MYQCTNIPIGKWHLLLRIFKSVTNFVGYSCGQDQLLSTQTINDVWIPRQSV
jgi:hypothetical protein